MIIDLVLITIGLIGLVAASITDIKTREVPDWLNYSLICIGFGLRLLHSLTYNEWNYFTYAIFGFFGMFIIGSIMYYAKQWGGGDTKLLMALGVIFATSPGFLKPTINGFPFLVTLFINILIVGAFYGLVYSLVLAIKHKKKFLKEFKKLYEKRKFAKRISLAFALTLLIILFLVSDLFLKLILAVTILFFLIYVYLWTAVKAIENTCMCRYIKSEKLTEGDWVIEKVKVGRKTIYDPKELGIEKRQIRKLIEAKIKKVLVKEGLPFVPSFLLGTLISLVFGNILFLII